MQKKIVEKWLGKYVEIELDDESVHQGKVAHIADGRLFLDEEHKKKNAYALKSIVDIVEVEK